MIIRTILGLFVVLLVSISTTYATNSNQEKHHCLPGNPKKAWCHGVVSTGQKIKITKKVTHIKRHCMPGNPKKAGC
ncbi:MAG: hypothetical protein ACJARD_000279 [Alphaproteobacteria bacterium]|jgi:hypothetical protein